MLMKWPRNTGKEGNYNTINTWLKKLQMRSINKGRKKEQLYYTKYVAKELEEAVLKLIQELYGVSDALTWGLPTKGVRRSCMMPSRKGRI